MHVTDNELVVIIPVYKRFQDLRVSELASFAQALNTLKQYKIYIVFPEQFDSGAYDDFAKGIATQIHFAKFPPKYFKGIDGYNKLLTSLHFYDTFASFHKMLIYQLDAWVFNADLSKWSAIGYDYIGAPLFHNYGQNADFNFVEGQNGGVSIRNIATARRILKRLSILRLVHIAVRLFSFNSIKTISGLLSCFKLNKTFKIVNHDYLRELFSRGVNEDYRWSFYIAKTFSDFEIAPLKEAISFCFEVHPSYLYQLNDKKLPFATHAWEKYEPEFWKQFIKTDKQGK